MSAAKKLYQPQTTGVVRYVTPSNHEFIAYAESALPGMSFDQAVDFYAEIGSDPNVSTETLAALGLIDRVFLMVVLLGRRDILHPWLYARCREVEANPDGHLDLWAREHYKSTIITFGGNIQAVLRNPNETIGIFSHTRPIAKQFLRQIKTEFETNQRLKAVYPDVLWADPRKQALKWSEDEGITVKRDQNHKEASIEAWGLVDGQPVSKHFSLLVYDDVVTLESVSNPDMILKVTTAWELSTNLGAHGGHRWMIGTRYHANDTWRTIMERGAAIPRIHPATEDGTETGKPVFLSAERLREKRKDMGPYTFAAQMLQNPTADKTQGFSAEWLEYWRPVSHASLNKYILVDPASSKKKGSDYTVMIVLGLSSDRKYRVVDWVRDRMNLTERTDMLIKLHRKYKPLGVGYEQYGQQADIEHIKFVQEQLNFRFTIKPLGGQIPKNDRIRGLVPVFEQGRMLLPQGITYINSEGMAYDPTDVFVREEYGDFPVSAHDDMLDCLARSQDPDMDLQWPEERSQDDRPEWAKNMRTGANRSFMSR